MSADLPVIVDTADRIDAFLDEIEPMVDGGRITREKATVVRYRSRTS